jgi:hypothetical protein
MLPGTTAVAKEAIPFRQIREVFFVFFVGRKGLLGSKHLAKS